MFAITRYARVVFSALILLLSFTGQAVAAIPSSERSALISFYQATGGAAWTDRNGWQGAEGTECSWFGITCNEAQTTVLGLGLGSNNLSGSLPSSISSLTGLRELFLYGNALTGSIPEAIGQLSSLDTLNLSGNRLTGSIPSSLANLTSLRYFDFEDNQLAGQIPRFLGNMAELREINLIGNAFSGSIPAELGQLRNLTGLGLGRNQLTGSIPPQLGDLTNLEWTYLGENQLTGPLPDLGRLTKLVYLGAGNNLLSGAIPPSFGSLPALTELDLGYNELDGAIPTQLGSLTALERLTLSANRLTGPIPSSLGNLRNLVELRLDSNRLSGSIPVEFATLTKLIGIDLGSNEISGPIPEFLADFAALEVINLYGNNLSGPIPIALARLQNLTELQLGENELTGGIPTQLSQLSKLQYLALQQNPLGGTIPPELGLLADLKDLDLSSAQLTGTIPDGLAALTKLEALTLSGNRLEGPIPTWLDRMPGMYWLVIGENRFTGGIPPQLMSLTKLTYLHLAGNQLSGSIPPGMENLKAVEYLDLSRNSLSGPFPQGLGEMTSLVEARLNENSLSGTLPSFQRLSKLELFIVGHNAIEGTIPRDIGTLPAIKYLSLGANRITGPIPAEIGQLTTLLNIDLADANLRGEIPASLLNLTNLIDRESDWGYNALSTSNTALRDFLNRKQYDGDWVITQTIPPANVRVVSATDRSATLSWTPQPFPWDWGGYQIIASASGSQAVSTTASIEVSSGIIRGLNPSTLYTFTVRTIRPPHDIQQNFIVSDPSPSVSATTSARVFAPADVAVTARTTGLVQIDGQPQNEDSFVLTNFGDVATDLTSFLDGSFFQVDPSSFRLEGGASQTVRVISLPQPPGSYWGSVYPLGAGVPEDMYVEITLLSVARPSGAVIAEAVVSRIDVSGEPNTTTLASASFKNVGSAPLTGVLVSDAAWITTPNFLIAIDPGQTTSLPFTVDRTKRPDGGFSIGAIEGSLRLVYVDGSIAKASLLDYRPQSTLPAGVSVSLVSVVDTSKPPVVPGSIPPLGADEIARVIPGIARLTSGPLKFVPDVSVANSFGSNNVTDLRLYFQGLDRGVSVATLGAIEPTQAVNLANFANTIFGGTAQSGSLFVRSNEWQSISMHAKLVGVRESRGTYSGALPVFRSSPEVRPGQKTVLAGVRKDATTHTNLYIQEMSGRSANYQIEFLSLAGTRIALRPVETIAGFALIELVDAVPPGTATAIVTNQTGSAGSPVAYGLVFDQASGDNWSIVDWSQYYSYKRDERVRVPLIDSSGDSTSRRRPIRRGTSSGATLAASGATTDLALFADGPGEAEVEISFVEPSGKVTKKNLTIRPKETKILTDVSQWTGSPGARGYLLVNPLRGSIALSGRISERSTEGGSIGTAVPVLASTAGLRLGQSQIFSGVSDSSQSAITSGSNGTYRTALGLVETGGASVRVRATMRAAESLSRVAVQFTREYALAPGQLLYVDRVTESLIGANRERYGDQRNVQIEFEVISGEGAVTLFLVATDNGSGDTILRTE